MEKTRPLAVQEEATGTCHYGADLALVVERRVSLSNNYLNGKFNFSEIMSKIAINYSINPSTTT
ncbi:hypothetical protein SynWH8103_00483 [Synechococcus sp. WH 8103]|nr:hypothetical protein SynWH8103_00483 [Synechococcus sp. WH 8103]